MKYLSDTEILNWNKRLEKSLYMVRPMSSSQGANPYISFAQTMYNSSSSWAPLSKPFPDQFMEISDPYIKFDFTFSVIENRLESFFELFNRLYKDKFGTKTIYKDKTSDVELSDKIIESRDSIIHKIYNRSYVRFSYKFSGQLSKIMAYISYLEDTINFFEKVWGYDESGKEHCLLKYPIGSIVSKMDDKSKDFLIIDYLYEKTQNNYIIDYISSEIMDGTSVIIKYGDVSRFKDIDLCFSRTNRIDDILN